MLDIVRLPADERQTVIQDVSLQMGLPEGIIEKDLWVCYLLDYLFNRSPFKDGIVFKGGTSLSKAYGLISRFSEDIDLILDWRLIGYALREPWEPRSNTQQDKFKLDTIERTNSYLANTFAPALKQDISQELGIDADVRVANEEETVIFAYPRLYSSEATLDIIKLEIGPLAAWSPSKQAAITPYIAEVHPDIFPDSSTSITTAVPERTFWEKATILHQEANRPESKAMPRRYARHYYDMYQLGNSEVVKSAVAQLELLDDVVAFKEKFYRTPWAKLTDAKAGTLKLVPPAYRINELESDYAAMRPMLFGEAPAFAEITAFLGALEKRINEE